MSLSLAEARRVALAAQGFARARPAGGADARQLRRTIRALGLLQIDSVNVLVPAHYQVVFARLGRYDRARLDRLVYEEREFAEQWAHEASIVPVDRWPLLRQRGYANEWRTSRFAAFLAQHAAYATWVLEEVRRRGPLAASELPEPSGERGKSGEWWGWTMAKTALEAHFATGALAIAARRSAGFARVYDLAERVLPPEHHAHVPERAEAERELLRLAAASLGVATAHDLADYYRMPLGLAKTRIAELVEEGTLRPATVEGWRERAYLHAEAATPRRLDAAALLSPFDPVVWYRPRAARLFDFDYRIEIYTPQSKRRWGYYVLPVLLGDRLVARLDLKADRAAGRLRVLASHAEPHARPGDVAPRLAEELRLMAEWLGLDGVAVERRGDLAAALRAEVRG